MIKVGLIIQDLATDYSNKIVQGTKQYCIENDLQLFIYTVRAKNWKNGIFDYEHYACKFLATKDNIDGILLVTNTYCQNIPKEQHTALVKELTYVPVVSFGAEIEGLSSVNGDASRDFKKLLEHLGNEHNCKSIYFMGPNSTSKDIAIRYNAYSDYMKERNQSIDDKLFYVNYTYDGAKKALKEKGISKDYIPFDAIVCCNDSMAFGCIDYLKEHGIRIPEDVKITGFDNQSRCDFTNPSLTSVDQCIEEQCYIATKKLHEEILNPNAPKKDFYVDAKVIYRCSCGCDKKKEIDESYEGKYFQLREQIYSYQYFLQDLQSTVDTEEIKSIIISQYKNFGVKSCICCIYDYPKKMLKNEDFILPEKASVFFAYNDEKIFEYEKSFFINPKENMYPKDFSFVKGKEVIVTALFNREYQYGYLIYTPGEMNYSIYELLVTTTGISLATNIVFSKKVQETELLSSEKKNLENETYFDEMTGAFNRRGFFKYAKAAMNEAIKRGQTGGVVFGDMDHLKLINDKYGHEAGDRAIKGEVEILKSVFRSQDIIGRLGGDEFVILACGLIPHGFDNLKIRLENATKKYNEEHNEPFEISISLGYVEFDESNCDIDILLKRADEAQYKEKVLHHKNRN